MIGCVLWRIDLVLFCVWREWNPCVASSRLDTRCVCLVMPKKYETRRTKQKRQKDCNLTKRWKRANEQGKSSHEHVYACMWWTQVLKYTPITLRSCQTQGQRRRATVLPPPDFLFSARLISCSFISSSCIQKTLSGLTSPCSLLHFSFYIFTISN